MRSGRFEADAEADQFEKGAVELDDVVLRAPGVPVAPADLESEPAIEIGLGVEIAGGDDEMIERAGHVEANRASASPCHGRGGPSRRL